MRSTIGPIAIILQLGAIVVVGTLLPLLVGLWLDNQFHTTPWLTLVSMIIGVLVAVTGVYRVINEQYKKIG